MNYDADDEGQYRWNMPENPFLQLFHPARSRCATEDHYIAQDDRGLLLLCRGVGLCYLPGLLESPIQLKRLFLMIIIVLSQLVFARQRCISHIISLVDYLSFVDVSLVLIVQIKHLK